MDLNEKFCSATLESCMVCRNKIGQTFKVRSVWIVNGFESFGSSGVVFSFTCYYKVVEKNLGRLGKKINLKSEF